MLTTISAVVLSFACSDLCGPPSDAEICAAADRLAAEALKQPGAAGLSVAVSRNGVVIHSKGYGLAEVEHGAPADENTLFRIGSITKQFTAAAVMKLVEQGKIGLDEPITKYLEDYNDHDAGVNTRAVDAHA